MATAWSGGAIVSDKENQSPRPAKRQRMCPYHDPSPEPDQDARNSRPRPCHKPQLRLHKPPSPLTRSQESSWDLFVCSPAGAAPLNWRARAVGCARKPARKACSCARRTDTARQIPQGAVRSRGRSLLHGLAGGLAVPFSVSGSYSAFERLLIVQNMFYAGRLPYTIPNSILYNLEYRELRREKCDARRALLAPIMGSSQSRFCQATFQADNDIAGIGVSCTKTPNTLLP